MKAYSIIPILLSAMLLSACGGSSGGDDDDDDSTPTPTPTPTPTTPTTPTPEEGYYENREINGRFFRSSTHTPGDYQSESYIFSSNNHEYDYIKSDCDDETQVNCETREEFGTVSYHDEILSSSGVTVREITFHRETVNGEDDLNHTQRTYNLDGDTLVLGSNDGSMVWEYPFIKQY